MARQAVDYVTLQCPTWGPASRPQVIRAAYLDGACSGPPGAPHRTVAYKEVKRRERSVAR